MGIKTCPQCGGKVSDSRNDCPHCKYNFASTKKCPDCEEQIDISLDECPICGHTFEKETVDGDTIATAPSPTETKDPAVDTAVLPSSPPEEECEEENDIICPYCSSSEAMQLGNAFYMCTVCKGKFVDTTGLPTPIIKVSSEPHSEVAAAAKNDAPAAYSTEKSTPPSKPIEAYCDADADAKITVSEDKVLIAIAGILSILGSLFLFIWWCTGVDFLCSSVWGNGLGGSFFRCINDPFPISLLCIIMFAANAIGLFTLTYYVVSVLSNQEKCNKFRITSIFTACHSATFLAFIIVSGVAKANYWIPSQTKVSCFVALPILLLSDLLIYYPYFKYLIPKKRISLKIDEDQKANFYILATAVICCIVGLFFMANVKGYYYEYHYNYPSNYPSGYPYEYDYNYPSGYYEDVYLSLSQIASRNNAMAALSLIFAHVFTGAVIIELILLLKNTKKSIRVIFSVATLLFGAAAVTLSSCLEGRYNFWLSSIMGPLITLISLLGVAVLCQIISLILTCASKRR